MTDYADVLITHAHMFTMRGAGVGYVADGAVAVQGSGIRAVGTTDELSARFDAGETIDASGHALLPGLVDAHMHTPWAAVRGVAQDVANWMQKALAPYARHMTPEAALAGTQLNVLEALCAGTTTMGDYATPYPGWADVFAQVGVRARLTPTINAMPPGGMAGWKVGDVYPLDEATGRASIDAAVAFARDWHGTADGRITVMLGPQGPDMIDRVQLLDVKRIAARAGLMLHVHVAQGDREIDQMLKRYGKRTPAYLQEIGYLDDQLLAVHLPTLDAPIRTIVPNLVYAGTGREVRTVMVAGRLLMRDRVLLTLDADAICMDAQAQASDVAARVAADPVHQEMALLAAMAAGQL